MPSDAERIARLEKVVGTLISWLCYSPLSAEATKRLLELLHDGDMAAVLARGEATDATR